MLKITTTQKGRKTEDWIRKISRWNILADLSRYGQDGVAALSRATPVETGEASESWGYRVRKSGRGRYSVEWFNTDTISPGGPPVVILIQYGHATGNGAYIQGRDFINPAIRPVFEKIERDIWKKVKNG